jgi:TPR repeat protein
MPIANIPKQDIVIAPCGFPRKYSEARQLRTHRLFCLMLLATSAMAGDLPSGKYRGEIGYNSVEASITLRQDKSRAATLLANGPRCTGYAEFAVTESGSTFVGRPGEGCTIKLNLLEGKLFVTEDHCEYFHGAECNFEAVLKMISSIPATATEYQMKSAEETSRFVSQATARMKATDAASSLKANSSHTGFDQAAESYARQDYASAFAAFRLLSLQGDARAQTMLATMFRDGVGAARDYSQSMYWYRKAADQGVANAQYHMGWMYAEGIGIGSDMQQALVWYQKAAKQGYVKAQYNLGLIYGNGRGVVQDLPKAASFYLAAAEKGDADAQNNLGAMYAKGSGVVLDYAKALAWYRRAAEQGDAAAQNNLGAMYARGRSVPVDWVQAYMWFYLSAEAGDRQGAANLAIANGNIDMRQAEQALESARQWRPCRPANGFAC